MTTASASPIYQPTSALRFSLSRVMRQALTAFTFILLIAGYSASHPASYRTASPPATTNNTLVSQH